MVHVFLCLRESLSYHRCYVAQTFPFASLQFLASTLGNFSLVAKRHSKNATVEKRLKIEEVST